jgi:aryl-alcohol dehydrogenase-like predicted oxidoreductase
LGFKKGVELANRINWIAEGRSSMAGAALRWILDQKEITCVIPGFRNQRQVDGNLEAMNIQSFSKAELDQLELFYQKNVSDFIKGAY